MLYKTLIGLVFVTASLSSGQAKPAAVTTNAPVVKSGVQTVFKTADLMNNKVVKVIASSEYQISIVFPRKVQSVGVNAAKQTALMATIDQYDGRVVYLDVIRPDGTANLNVRLLTPDDEKPGGGPRDPVILKLLVALTKKENGVLAYTIRDAAPVSRPVAAAKPKPAPAKPAPIKAAAAKPAPAKPVVKPVAAKPVVKPTPAKPVAAKPTPVQPASAKPAAPKPAPVALTPRPKPAPKAKPTTFYGSNDGLKVEARVDRTAADAVTVNYTISQDKPKEGTLYLFDNQAVQLRIRDDVSSAALERGQPRTAPLNSGAPTTGSIRIPKSEINKAGAKILMFTFQEKDSGTNRLGQKKFLGVMLK